MSSINIHCIRIVGDSKETKPRYVGCGFCTNVQIVLNKLGVVAMQHQVQILHSIKAASGEVGLDFLSGCFRLSR